MSRWANVLVLVLVGGLVACQPAEPPPPPEPDVVRVEVPELGIAIADVPTFFKVAAKEDGRLILEPAAAEIQGRFEVSAEVSDPNLVLAIETHKETILGRPDGEYKGQRELMSETLGTAFYSRGRYTAEDGTALEETALFTLHPDGDRRLDLVYVYPVGEDTQQRLEDHLFWIFGEIVPLASEGAAGDGNGEGEEQDATSGSAA